MVLPYGGDEANFANAAEVLTTISPTNNQPILSRSGLTDSEVALLPAISTQAFNEFRLTTTFSDRQTIVATALRILAGQKDRLARELTEQIGRPIQYAGKEITTALARGEYLLKISSEALRDTAGEPEKGFRRYIRKAPLGPVLIIFAWNVGLLILTLSTHLLLFFSYLRAVTIYHVYIPIHIIILLTNGPSLPHAVPLPNLNQLPDPRSPRWQLCHPQTLTPNPYHRRAHPRYLPPSRSAPECSPILPLRLSPPARIHRPLPPNPPSLLHRLRRSRPHHPARSIRPRDSRLP